MKLFIILNLDTFFLSHRKEIAIRALQEGYDVTIVAKDTGFGEEIKRLGLKFINLPINKTGLNILEEFKTFSFLYKLFRSARPDIVHLVGMKIILWGGIAARLSKVKGLISAVCGLGVLFSPEYNVGVRKIISQGLIITLRYIHRATDAYCIFHNTDDMNLFVQNHIIDADRCLRTMGSGIDLNEYIYVPEQMGDRLVVLFTARMVEDKGVLVLIEAAKILKDEYSNKVQFLLCGGLDTNPLAVSKERLEALCDGDYIQWLGKRDDVHELLEKSHIFAFPSYYKEGLPKSCIEAAAVGRPIITCDSVGCRDTVIDGVTGYLIPIKNSVALAEKLKCLIDNESHRKSMGYKSREYAERNFSLSEVISVHMNIYDQLIKNSCDVIKY